MAILSISSHVARGHVGNSSLLAVANLLGADVWTIPTIHLSSHKAHPKWAGATIAANDIMAEFDALADNGWLGEITAVLTGYMAQEDQIDACADMIARLKQHNPDCIYWCDPVLGDDPGGLYVGEDIAQSTRSNLLPLADVISPNAFELGWLTDAKIDSPQAVAGVAKNIEGTAIIATSVPAIKNDQISNVLAGDGFRAFATHQRFESVPHGTGDVFTALAAVKHAEQSCALDQAIAYASAITCTLAEATSGRCDDNLTITDIRAAIDNSPNALRMEEY